MAHDYLKYVSHIHAGTLQELMAEHGRDVWNYAFFLTRNRHAADDVSQDVFLQAFLHIASFRGQSSMRTWLFSIARNKAANYRKSAFIRKVTLVDFLYPVVSEKSAEEQYMNQAFTDSIWELVLKLPPKYREVLVLDARYDMPLTEISLLLGVTVGTVKSRLHRARSKMKAYLGEAERDE
ncbi:RNA polymerase sigma factor [Cohnella candidum]|nr:RNA polymerase sigma factor [Cohnella candidum]